MKNATGSHSREWNNAARVNKRHEWTAESARHPSALPTRSLGRNVHLLIGVVALGKVSKEPRLIKSNLFWVSSLKSGPACVALTSFSRLGPAGERGRGRGPASSIYEWIVRPRCMRLHPGCRENGVTSSSIWCVCVCLCVFVFVCLYVCGCGCVCSCACRRPFVGYHAWPLAGYCPSPNYSGYANSNRERYLVVNIRW